MHVSTATLPLIFGPEGMEVYGEVDAPSLQAAAAAASVVAAADCREKTA